MQRPNSLRYGESSWAHSVVKQVGPEHTDDRRERRQTGHFSRLAPARLFPMNRRSTPFTLQQAADESPTLAGLLARAHDASRRLKAVEELIPAEMRPAVQAGPAEGDVWCLLVNGSAAAAKLRQLSPMLVARLNARGWEVASIRIKVQTRR